MAGNLTGGGGGLFSDAEVEARFEYLTEGVILTIVSCVGLGRTELDAVVTLTELFLSRFLITPNFYFIQPIFGSSITCKQEIS